MDWWSLAPYWVPALAAVIAVVVLIRVARSRAARRATRPRQGASAAVDVSYLDSSHMGEPQTGPRFDLAAPAGGASRRARH